MAEQVKDYKVYMHVTPDGKRYIGITGKPKVENRWHSGSGYRLQFFYEAVQEFGWDNIEHKQLAHGLSEEQAQNLEKKLIKHYKTEDKRYGYNRSEGGKITCHNEETKLLISQNNSRWFLGKHLPEETRVKISKSHHKNKKPVRCIDTGIEYESIHDASRKTGIPANYIVSCCKKDKHQTYGLVFEYINEKDKKTKNYVQTSKRPVRCIETNVVYDSIMEASRETNINRVLISRCVRGICMTGGTYHWEYATDKPINLRSNVKPVVCLENNTLYNSCAEAGKHLKCTGSAVSAVCRGKHKTTHNYHFMYYPEFTQKFPHLTPQIYKEVI